MAYVLGSKKSKTLDWLPLQNIKVSDSLTNCEFDYVKESEHETIQHLLNDEIEAGNTYPQENQLSLAEFKQYFLAADAFVLRHQGKIVGTFYVKPNFPGRSDHICNAGFIVSKDHRGHGECREIDDSI